MFNLAEVFLKKLDFALLRENLLNASSVKIESNVDIQGKFNKENNVFSVILKTDIKGFEKQIEIINISVVLEGIFVAEGKVENAPNDEAIDIFTKVKAPQILFPFVVENIHNLTLRAKVKPLIIPYIDFKKLYYESKEFSGSIH